MSNNYFTDIQLLKQVIETAPIPIGVYTGDELIIELANARMMETYGKGNDVIGRSYKEILPELQNQPILEQIRSVQATGIPFHATNQRVDIVIGGVLRPHYFNYSFTPLYDAEGRLYGIMNTGMDVTDINLARQQAATAGDKLRMAVEAADLGICEVDYSTGAATTNGNFRHIWDLDDPVTYDGIIARLHPDDVDTRDKAHKSADSSGRVSYETRIFHRDNSVRWLKINAKYITDAAGSKMGIIGIIHDITEQKKFEQHLESLVQERTAELNRSNKDLVQFAHVVTHDLKEPVRKISMFSKILEDNYSDSLEETGVDYLRRVKAATTRMTTMIDGVLSYSMINAGDYPSEEVDLNLVMEDIKADLELVINEKKAFLISDELPVVEGSPILLYQLFYNLVNNALKFSRADVPPRVIITAQVDETEGKESVIVKISDNGIGFSESFTEKIFNAFERLHSKDKYDGTGLGLSLCRKIVERHNGTISASGKPDEGADFVVTLPLRQPAEKFKLS